MSGGHIDLIADDGTVITGLVYDVRVTPPRPANRPPLTLYSQNDPRWKDDPFAGGVPFGGPGGAGCYTVAVAMINSLTGSLDEPPIVARALREAGCFEGAYLTHPERIPDACPGLCYDGPFDVSKDGPLRWHRTAADMDRVYEELSQGSPIIMEVDFAPGGEFNQHFIVCESWNEETGDLQIADPWDGTRKELLAAYSPVFGGWDLKRAIYGLRLLRVI